LKEETFETEFVNLTKEEGEALVDAYLKFGKQTKEQLDVLDKLEARLDISIQSMVKKTGAAFIRLSTRRYEARKPFRAYGLH